MLPRDGVNTDVIGAGQESLLFPLVVLVTGVCRHRPRSLLVTHLTLAAEGACSSPGVKASVPPGFYLSALHGLCSNLFWLWFSLGEGLPASPTYHRRASPGRDPQEIKCVQPAVSFTWFHSQGEGYPEFPNLPTLRFPWVRSIRYQVCPVWCMLCSIVDGDTRTEIAFSCDSEWTGRSKMLTVHCHMSHTNQSHRCVSETQTSTIPVGTFRPSLKTFFGQKLLNTIGGIQTGDFTLISALQSGSTSGGAGSDDVAQRCISQS